MNPSVPTQLGYTPTGSAYQSTVVIGRNVNATWEAVGFGAEGRPDYLERLTINLTSPSGASLVRKGVVNIDVGALVQAINANPFAPSTGFQFAFREVSVCEVPDGSSSAVERRMMVIASQTYATGAS